MGVHNNLRPPLAIKGDRRVDGYTHVDDDCRRAGLCLFPARRGLHVYPESRSLLLLPGHHHTHQSLVTKQNGLDSTASTTTHMGI
jgi:hypothetical protein